MDGVNSLLFPVYSICYNNVSSETIVYRLARFPFAHSLSTEKLHLSSGGMAAKT